MAVDLEEGAQSGARVAAAEAIRSKSRKAPHDVCGNQLGISADIVGRGDDGGLARQTGSEMAPDGVGVRIEPVPALGAPGVTGEFRVARNAPDFGGDAPLRFEHARTFDDLAKDGSRTKQANEPLASSWASEERRDTCP